MGLQPVQVRKEETVPMKWPKDNKERAKILVLIAMGVGVVIYLVIAGAVNPIRTKRKDYKAQITGIKAYLEQAKKKIAHTAKNQEDNYKAIVEIKDMTDNYLLKPRLGNFLLSATDELEKHAKAVDMADLPQVREVGIKEVLKPQTRTTDYVFKSYSAGVTLNCGLNKMIEYLQEIEQANPCVCISRLTIITQGKTPEKHKITFEIQWPIWANADNEKKLEEQLREAEEARQEAEKLETATGEGEAGALTNAQDSATEPAAEKGE
jgi:hypothetical protein